MAKRKRKARRFKVGDCVKAPWEHGDSVGRIVERPSWTRRGYRVKFFGQLRPMLHSAVELKHAACTRSTPLAGPFVNRRRR